jgi:hypothetical protein
MIIAMGHECNRGLWGWEEPARGRKERIPEVEEV